MSGPQPNAWNHPRPSQSSNRTPESRSGNASPSQQGNTSKPQGGRPPQQATSNAWTERSRSASVAPTRSNGKPAENANANAATTCDYVPINSFNAREVKVMLGKDVRGAPYKVAEGGSGRSGGTWASKVNHMANNQPFFVQLSKQVAALENNKGG